MTALPSASSRWLLVAAPLFLAPLTASAAVTLTFEEADFAISYAKGKPADDVPLYPGDTLNPADPIRIALMAQAQNKYGYNQLRPDLNDEFGVNPQRDLINASFFTLSGDFPNGKVVVRLNRQNDAASFRIGLGFLTENYIAARPLGIAGQEDFSFQYDPSHPEELDIKIDVTIPGTGEVLHFKSTPQVVAGPAFMYLAADPTGPFFGEVDGRTRGQPASAKLPGSSRDPNRFRVHFEPQQFMVPPRTFTMEIEDIVFANPSLDPATGTPISFFPTNPGNPIDAEPITVRITLNR